MTLSLPKFKPLEAPDKYLFVDPDTGRKFQDATKHGIIKQIVSYRVQNELEPLEYLGVVIEAYMCSLPQYKYKCEQSAPFGRSIFAYMKGGMALIKNMFYGEKNIVDQDVADKRSDQCIKCPNNVFPDKSDFLRWSDAVAEASTHGKKSKNYSELGNCKVCSCPLKAKVWYKGGDEKHTEKEIDEFKKVDCWQLPPGGS